MLRLINMTTLLVAVVAAVVVDTLPTRIASVLAVMMSSLSLGMEIANG